MARKKTLAAALVSLACLQAGSTYALGLGELTLESFLNEPLRARVSLLDIGSLHEDQIRVRLATPDDFDRLGVDRAYFLTSIKFSVEIDGSGRGVIVLTSEDPVLEPYLDFIVETRWPSGRLLRNYTVLVDPPVFDTRAPAVSASERVAATEDSEAVVAAEKKTETETGDTGTRVSMRESALAPGTMPQRNFGADTAPEPAPGARYMIRRDETLWTIAQRARVDGVSVQQTMLEIQRLNPDAFIDGNINRIKAGFIIYLPASGDISQADIDATLATVRQQNEDWRAGRPSAPGMPGPALRISSGEDAQAEEDAAAPAQSSAGVETLDELQRSERERDDLGQRLAALAERMETLERVVELKDAQIASLQQALAAAESAAVTVPVTESPPAGDQLAAVTDAPGAIAEPVLAEPAVPAPAPAPAPASSGGFWNGLYTLGGVLIAVLLGLLLWRRRQGGENAGDGVGGFAPRALLRRPSEPDAFADIKLRDSELDLDEEDGGLDSDIVSASPVAARPVAAPSAPVTAIKRSETTAERGYGERRHDQYASDVEAGDALAEADIYIAYGRYAQAIDLLRKALRSEPDNVAYRLKLVGLAAETGDRGEAELQVTELKRIGQAEAVAQAEVILDSIIAASPMEQYAGPEDFMLGEAEPEDVAVTRPLQVPEVPAVAEDLSSELEHLSFPGSADSLVESMPAPDAEPEFLGLEIENSPIEELDLAAEFDRERERSLSDSSEDDFVFADDGDPLSTKLDLARAYIDMGDDDGARQILEEVLAEGNDEQQRDARELLDRLG